MPIDKGVSAVATASNSTTIANSGIATQASGSVLAACVVWLSSGGTTFSSIADNKGNSANFQQVSTQLTLPAALASRVYYVENATGGSGHIITVTFNQAAVVSTLWVVEITGAMTSGALDQADRQTDTATPWVSPGITTTQANELLLGFSSGEGGGANPLTHTAGNSFTSIDQQTDGNNFYPGISMYRIVSATGTYNTSITLSNEGAIDDMACWILSFKEILGDPSPSFRASITKPVAFSRSFGRRG